MNSPEDDLGWLEQILKITDEEDFTKALQTHQAELNTKLDALFKGTGEVNVETLTQHFRGRFKDILKFIFSTHKCQWTQDKKKRTKKLNGNSKSDNGTEEKTTGVVKRFFCKQCNAYHYYKSAKK